MALFVLLLVGIDVLILTIFLMVEGVRNRLNDVKVVQDRENPMSTEGVRIYIVNKIDINHFALRYTFISCNNNELINSGASNYQLILHCCV